jgi:phage-related protein
MSTGYDGNIKLGVSLATDTKAVMAELGALRKQIVDMFSSVDKSLAGGSGSFSNLEKILTTISVDVSNIAKKISSLPTDKLAKMADSLKGAGTAAKDSGKQIETAFDFDVANASTEELYQKLKQLKKEAEDLKQQKFLAGFTNPQIDRSKDYKALTNQASYIESVLHGRGLSTEYEYKPHYSNMADDITKYRQSLEEARKALAMVQDSLVGMKNTDDGYQERIERARELTEVIKNLHKVMENEYNSLFTTESAPVEDTNYVPHGNPNKNKADAVDLNPSPEAQLKYQAVYSALGRDAAESFMKQYREVLADKGYIAGQQFVDSFNEGLNTNSDDSNSLIAKGQKAIQALQTRIKDFEHNKITMSDEEYGEALTKLEKMKAYLAELKQDAKDISIDAPIDSYHADTLREFNNLQAKMERFKSTGRGFADAEEAQSASMRIAQLAQTIQEYNRSLDPSIQKMNDYKRALSEMAVLNTKSSMSGGLTEAESAQFEEASRKVQQYENDLQSLIQIHKALESTVKQAKAGNLGISVEELNLTKQLLADVKTKLDALTGDTKPAFDMTVSNRQLVQARNLVNELTAKKKQMEAQGMGAGYAEYDELVRQLKRATHEYERLSGSAKNTHAIIQTAKGIDNAYRKVTSTISKLIKKVGALTNSILHLGKHSKKTARQMQADFRRTLRYVLGLGFGIEGIFTLFRRFHRTAFESLGVLASQFSEFNEPMSETMTLLTKLKGALATAFQPLITMVLPVINSIITALTNALNLLGKFFASLSGQGFIYKATAAQQDFAGSLDKTNKSAKEATKSLMGFDEINKLNEEPKDSDAGADSGLTFEKVPIDPNEAIAKFAQMLKDAWAKGDFFDVGKFLGEQLRDGLLRLDNWITTKGYALAEKIGKSFATLINGIVSVDGLPEIIGKTVADAINMGMRGLYNFLSITEWYDVGAFIADAIMSFFHNIDWELLGQTVAEYILAFVDTIWALIEGIDFEAIGTYLSTAVNEFLDTMFNDIDDGLNGWERLGDSISNAIIGLLDLLITAIQTTDWSKVGKAIGDVFANIDWSTIAWKVGELISSFISALVEGFINWGKTDPISAAIAAMLGTAVIGAKVTMGVVELLEFIQRLEKAFGGFKVGGFTTALTTAKTALSNFGTDIKNVTTSIGNFMKSPIFTKGLGLAGVIGGAITAFSGFFEMLQNGFSWANEAVMLFGIAITGIGAVMLGVVSGPWAAAIAGIVAAVATAVVLIKEHWDSIVEWWHGICDKVKTAWNNMWGKVKEGSDAAKADMEESGANVGQGFLDGVLGVLSDIGGWAKEYIVDPFVNCIKSLFGIHSPSTVMYEIGTNVILGFLNAIVDGAVNVITAIHDFVAQVIEAFGGLWDNIVTVATDSWNYITEWLMTGWTNLCNWFSVAYTTFSTAWNAFWQSTLECVVNTWTNICESVSTFANDMYTKLQEIISAVWEFVTNKVTELKTWLMTTLSQLGSNIATTLNNIRNTFIDVFNGIRSSVGNIVESMGNMIKRVIDGIKSAITNLVGSVKSAVNNIISSLNSLSFTVPSWVPGFGGQNFSFNIPHLAKGAVIPPNKEFMAVLGDQKHGTNIEAPLDTIKQAVAEELSDYIDAMMAGFDAVVNAIDNKDMSVSIGDSAIGRAAERYNRRQQLVRGTT